jgi:glycosyltransferase involved in cell wall biosynthesis
MAERAAPDVTVGIPVYNGERYVAAALDSILAQSYGDFEVVISDNASTDRTAEICRAYAARDSRIRYVRQSQNIGGPRNWNAVVALAAPTRYFKWAAANDTIQPHFLARCRAVLEADPGVVLAYSNTMLIDEAGRPVDSYRDPLRVDAPRAGDRFLQVLRTLALNNAQAGLIRRDALMATHLEGVFAGGDVALMAELALHGRYHRIAEPLFHRRMAADAATTNLTREQLAQFVGATATADFVPLWRSWLRNLRDVATGPLAWGERARLWVALLGEFRRDRGTYAREVLRWTRARLGLRGV